MELAQRYKIRLAVVLSGVCSHTCVTIVLFEADSIKYCAFTRYVQIYYEKCLFPLYYTQCACLLYRSSCNAASLTAGSNAFSKLCDFVPSSDNILRDQLVLRIMDQAIQRNGESDKPLWRELQTSLWPWEWLRGMPPHYRGQSPERKAVIWQSIKYIWRQFPRCLLRQYWGHATTVKKNTLQQSANTRKPNASVVQGWIILPKYAKAREISRTNSY